jgi:DNA-binding NtrC family response regulator
VVTALRSGAYDYLIKPSDVDELRATIGRALERRRLGPAPPPRSTTAGRRA